MCLKICSRCLLMMKLPWVILWCVCELDGGKWMNYEVEENFCLWKFIKLLKIFKFYHKKLFRHFKATKVDSKPKENLQKKIKKLKDEKKSCQVNLKHKLNVYFFNLFKNICHTIKKFFQVINQQQHRQHQKIFVCKSNRLESCLERWKIAEKNFKFSVKIPLKVQKAPLVHVSCAFMSLLASRTCWHLSLSRGPFSMTTTTTKPVAMNIFLVKKLNFHSRGAIEEFPECALWNCHSHTCFSHLFHCWVIAHMT